MQLQASFDRGLFPEMGRSRTYSLVSRLWVPNRLPLFIKVWGLSNSPRRESLADWGCRTEGEAQETKMTNIHFIQVGPSGSWLSWVRGQCSSLKPTARVGGTNSCVYLLALGWKKKTTTTHICTDGICTKKVPIKMLTSGFILALPGVCMLLLY